MFFKQGIDTEMAEEAAAGWNGDKLYVYRKKDQNLAFVWIIAFDSKRDLGQALTSLENLNRDNLFKAKLPAVLWTRIAHSVVVTSNLGRVQHQNVVQKLKPGIATL